MSDSPEPTAAPVLQPDGSVAKPGLKFTTTGELLPKNQRTDKLLEGRKQEEMKRK